ncbi:MAG TPA: NAD(P)-dependent oxidoreductase [Saprospiraceae bacterium]|nr:NAD(P)-dependent oxidoreductase [Saprospiraceae bacterium]HNT21539.1 NAD(P)-dependent oxidoreductase [Saprospiraceae bacterium]
MEKIGEIYQKLLRPSSELIADISSLDGDILILGAGGKMGPALARKAKQAIDAAGINKKVIGVARFSEAGLEKELNREGIETLRADLLRDDQLQALPTVKNVLYLAGTKFGTQGNESFTWAMNAYLPGRVAEKFKDSRIVVFSTGNVYPFVSVKSGGAHESIQPEPLGDYGQSCLGRERLFQYFSILHRTPILIYRLNYANDVSYGVLLEIGKSVKSRKPIDLNMGHVNVIWQGDANEIALRALPHCAVPCKLLNVTGPETASVRWIANEFGSLFGEPPIFTGEEQDTALLSNAAECFRLFGYPRVGLKQMIGLLARWIEEGGKTINKETHFQERKGKF